MTSHNFNSRPLYLQVRDALADRIAKLEWTPGMTIHNENDLAREFEVSAGTMRKALDTMEGEGLLTRRQGRGTFVNNQVTDKVLALRFSNVRGVRGERLAGKVCSVGFIEDAANSVERDHLNLKQDARVYRLRYTLRHNDVPYMFKEASLPVALFPGLSQAQIASYRIVTLCQQFGVLLGTSTETVSTEFASETTANAIGIATGTAVLRLDRTISMLAGPPIEWRIGHLHPVNASYIADVK